MYYIKRSSGVPLEIVNDIFLQLVFLCIGDVSSTMISYFVVLLCDIVFGMVGTLDFLAGVSRSVFRSCTMLP